MERAIRLNGAAVETTLAAFRWGRAAAIDHDAVLAALVPPAPPVVAVDARSAALARTVEGLDDVLATRIADLTGYQDAAYAGRYAEEVRRVAALASEAVGPDDGSRVARAYARGLHRLMAYKDEYEVARLHLDPVEVARREAEYGADADVSVMLHPPVLRALGMHRKIRLRGRTAEVTFRALRAARGLRHTPFDVFGRAEVRAVERALVGEYQETVRTAVEHLGPDTLDVVLEVVELAELIRGYEDVKLRAVERFRERCEELLGQLAG